MDCIFCKIAAGEIPANITYEDDLVIAFDDANPSAPLHKLIIPKAHIATLNDMNDPALMGHIMLTAKQIAKEINIADDGYRTIINCNAGGGQMIYHIHCHLLGGRPMEWPPG
jgi:histidine triad (HIT) family protein